MVETDTKEINRGVFFLCFCLDGQKITIPNRKRLIIMARKRESWEKRKERGKREEGGKREERGKREKQKEERKTEKQPAATNDMRKSVRPSLRCHLA